MVSEALFGLAALGIIFGLCSSVTVGKNRKSNEDLSNSKDESTREKNLADEFLSRYNLPGSSESFDLLLDKVFYYEKLVREANDRRFEYNLAKERLEGSSQSVSTRLSSDEISEKIRDCEAEKLNLQRKIALSEKNVEELLLLKEEMAETEATLKELKSKLAEDEKSLEIIRMTKLLLEEAMENLGARHLGKIRESFIKYSEFIKGGSSPEPEIDTSFKITFSENGISRPSEGYSKGTRELYGLIARFALIDSLYKDNFPPVILDDPFASYDDARLSKALSLLEELAKSKQVIYFTPSRARTK